MYYEFIDMNQAPTSIREVVEDIHLALNDTNYSSLYESAWSEHVLRDNMEKMNKNAEKILASVLTMEREKEGRVFLLQMAIYRWCTVHLPKILDSEWLYSFKSEVNMKGWEKKFWIDSCDSNAKVIENITRVSHTTFKTNLYDKRKELQQYKKRNKSWLKEIKEMADKDIDTITSMEAEKGKYIVSADKAKKINSIMKQEIPEENAKISVMVQNLKNLMEIMERNLQGELTAGDIMTCEEKKEEWGKSIQYLVKVLDKLE